LDRRKKQPTGVISNGRLKVSEKVGGDRQTAGKNESKIKRCEGKKKPDTQIAQKQKEYQKMLQQPSKF